MGLKQGEAFVHRNIANICVSSDLSLLSVIFYAVNILKVKDIFVLGHYGCGGVMAASNNKDLGLIEHWIHNIRDVQRLHNDELQKISDPERRHQRLVELNVQEQCLKLFSNSFVQHMQAETKQTQIKMYPRIHGTISKLFMYTSPSFPNSLIISFTKNVHVMKIRFVPCFLFILVNLMYLPLYRAHFEFCIVIIIAGKVWFTTFITEN